MSADVAIVVPVLDDAAALELLLARISAWPHGPDEVVVVSAGPSEAVEQVCGAHGARLVIGKASRGAQLDRGARVASARVLWFLHADAAPADGALAAIERAVAEGAESGCFRFEFEGPSTWRKRLLATLVGWRVRLGGTPYGDQGLFVLRDAYRACGGFPDQPLFEEVTLVRALRRRGSFRALDVALPVSARRWQRDGWWTRTCHNRWLALCYMLGVPVERLARAYSRRRNAGGPRT